MVPKVTALVSVFNEETLIRRAVASLLGQTLRDIEVLVIDDGSTDGTGAAVARLGDDRLRLIRRGERGGQATALALGGREARGRYVANLDADDEAYPERLERQAAFLDANPDHAWVGCGEEQVDTRRGEHFRRLYPPTDRAIRRQAAKCIPYSHSGVMFRRSLIDEGINYDSSEPIFIDFDLFIRVAARHKVANLPEVLVRRYVRGESFYQRTFSTGRQNRRLALLSAKAVHRFRLPPWYYAYPALRLAYPLLPNGVKSRVRVRQGLEETAA